MSDPLPAPAIVKGTWSSITTGHKLVYLGEDRVLDWVPLPYLGQFRIWRYDRTATGGRDPFPGDPVTQGAWQSIREGHVLSYLGADRVLDWEPATGEWRVWRYDRTVTNGDPFHQLSASGHGFKGPGVQLIPMGSELLHWNVVTGEYKLWRYKGDSIDDKTAQNKGTWKSIRLGHELIYLAGQVLDWVPATGDYRIWRYEPNLASIGSLQHDFLLGPPVKSFWDSIRTGHELIYLSDDRVLDWEPANGHYRIWGYDRSLFS